jgi:hypothetical protein
MTAFEMAMATLDDVYGRKAERAKLAESSPSASEKKTDKAAVEFGIVQAPKPRCRGVVRRIKRVGLD